jgi:xanthine dehydrogenase accessory factor
MKNSYEEVTEALAHYPRLACATIAESDGSTPRIAGTKMIVCPDRKIINTIGGGPFELLVIEDALQLIRSGKPLLKKYSFNPEGKDAIGAVCGGTVTVFIEVFGGGSKLFVIGAGHVGRALVKAAALLPFEITVVDDREGCLKIFDNDAGIHTVLTPSDYSAIPEPSAETFVCIVSHDHKHDTMALQRVIRSQAKYIGLMGSAKKIKTVFEQLQSEGYGPDLLKKVHAPIGLPIYSETPEEIAVSILGDIIKVKNDVN